MSRIKRLHKVENIKKKMKKAQIEMLGLVIVVVLIVLGLLFFLWFTAKPEKPTRETITAMQAYNLMNALMNIEPCPDVSIKKAIAQDGCDGVSLNDIEKDIQDIMEEIILEGGLLEEKKAYILVVDKKGETGHILEIESETECKYGITSGKYLFKEEGDYYNATLKICG